VLHYQPIVSMQDNKITGFEALVRWQHPERGLVPPLEFIPLAEETGLIIPIGQWVLYEACRQMHEWQERYTSFQDLTISVNISTKEFSQPNFVQLVERILQETVLTAISLKLEITERMIIENYEHAADIFRQLNALNVQMQIDDFGTGHSALNYMLHLPIDALKIDRSFVRRAAIDEDVREIVKTIIALAHTMKMDVIAEGVETMEELAIFKDMESEYAQGYFFSKPLNNSAVEALFC
jgi:EAL domain-containing protein (putative c-di-GMP-specific phosphodiesterase class I)